MDENEHGTGLKAGIHLGPLGKNSRFDSKLQVEKCCCSL